MTEGPFVIPPVWANRYHRLTFGKIGALALTQFDKVFVFDNDMALAHNVDHLAFAQTPSAVWHTSMARWQVRGLPIERRVVSLSLPSAAFEEELPGPTRRARLRASS